MKKIIVSMVVFTIALLNTNLPDQLSSWNPEKKVGRTSLVNREIGIMKKESFLPESKLLDVPLINQFSEPHLYKGCEVTSLAMILNHHGIEVTKNQLAEKIITVPFEYPNQKKGNPHVGFVGDMADGPGLSVYNEPIFDLAKEYAGEKVMNLTNSPFDDLLKKVGRGIPVWVIITSKYTPGTASFEKWDTLQGTMYVTFNVHSVVITGYDQNSLYINDPFGYKNRKVDKKNFILSWEEMGSQAIAIEK
ncbi:C39 family peptidase [Neobacillus sp. YX16]|uniref:C39 family peptidase n=1 Tax=Neobacillus sp. YX16 TaxID=3047874 RepID=UPI0024C34C74|nr:C39 family peptidase [Neobacillus sp. YX16]WHZ05375.1 C39 family peptidase [Neobacillus sp. YX16]